MLSVFPAAVPTTAAKEESKSNAAQIAEYVSQFAEQLALSSIEEAVNPTQVGEYTVDNPQNLPDGEAPEKFDLRDVDGKNYVTPVRFQNPYGTCWAFSAIAAAESSIAANVLDLDMNTATDDEKALVDFSERHLAWFVGHPIVENSDLYASQAGEGIINKGAEAYLQTEDATNRGYNERFFNSGGYMAYATSIFSSYQGPVSESLVPYQCDEGWIDGEVRLIHLERNPLEDADSPEAQAAAEKANATRTIEHFLPEEGYMGILEKYKALDSKGEPRYSPEITKSNDSWEGEGWYLYKEIQEEAESSTAGTWAVDESLRFQSAYELRQSNMLPSPCTVGENGAYQFDENGLNAIKQELLQKRAVSITFCADQSMPGQTTSGTGFMNFIDEDGKPTTDSGKAAYWCQYTYDKSYDPSNPESINQTVGSTHAVTIIGYDDTIPKEYFNDPNGTIGGDGAFIVKNSWGEGWGNSGTGYFYISYYDQSIKNVESFTFDQRGGLEEDGLYVKTNQMYDLMPVNDYQELVYDDEASMVNVFTADKDMLLDAVGYTAVTSNEQVTYDVYLLDDGDEIPEGKESVSHLEAAYQYAGFQRSDLETPVVLKKGQKYAIKVTVQREDGRYGIGLKDMWSESFLGFFADYCGKQCEEMQKMIDAEKASEEPNEELIAQLEASIVEFSGFAESMQDQIYSTSVVNPGESFMCVGGTWADWADVIEEVGKTEYGNYYNFDNFGIKAFAKSNLVDVSNTVAEPKDSYKAGDEVLCSVNVTNNQADELGGLTVLLNGEEISVLDSLAPGESTSVDYTYTITEEDIENGKFETKAVINLTADDITVPLSQLKEFDATLLSVNLKEEEQQPESDYTPYLLENADDIAGYFSRVAEQKIKYGTSRAITDVTSDACTYTVDDPANLPTAPALAKFDLRDVDGKNYVSPIKDQTPYGTCWAFSAIAAAETSVIKDVLNIDMNTATDEQKALVDLSERHLAWFAAHPITEDSALYPSQAGEGQINRGAEDYMLTENATQRGYNNIFFQSGGQYAWATSIFSSYQGPVSESLVPYQCDEGWNDGKVMLVYLDKPIEEMTMEERMMVVLKGNKQIGYTSDEGYMDILKEYDALDSNGEPKWDADFKGTGWYVLDIVAPDPSVSSTGGTWAVDESLRFQSSYELRQSNMLPSPATHDNKLSYVFNEAGVNAIKQELVNGKAVSIAFKSDQSIPGEVTDGKGFMRFLDADGNFTDDSEKAEYWCHYTYDKKYNPENPDSVNQYVGADHAVTIIGYDDTIPKEYFNDPNGTIGGDGAFIVKNSWGEGWGMHGEGCFYLSYYDQSIRNPESFTFDLRGGHDEEGSYVNTNQMYDLMPATTYQEAAYDKKASMANVFTAEKDMLIESVGYMAITNNEQVAFDVYLLDDGDTTPAGKESVAHLETTYQYAGFMNCDLETPVAVREGQKYAVKVTVKREDGKYAIGTKMERNREQMDIKRDFYLEQIPVYQDALEEAEASGDASPEYIAELKTTIMTLEQIADDAIKGIYCKGVVNKGESLVCVDDKWIDWADAVSDIHSTEYGKYFEFDNFSIKTVAKSDIVKITNKISDTKKSYKAGDEVTCAVTVKNNLPDELDSVVVYVDDIKLQALDPLAPGESTTVEYKYTVTEEDVKNGKFETKASVALENEEIPIPVAVNQMSEFNESNLSVEIKKEEETQPKKDYASVERFAEMSRKDYQKKNGGTVTANAVRNDDDTVTVTIKDKNGNTVDTYVLDAKTGIGENSKGEEVNLPQTGTTNPAAAAAATGAAAAVTVGAYLIFRSIRKKDEE